MDLYLLLAETILRLKSRPIEWELENFSLGRGFPLARFHRWKRYLITLEGPIKTIL